MSELGVYTYEYVQKNGPRTFMLLHGTGGNERDFLPVAELLDPDAHLLSVRGNVTEDGMARYFRRTAPGVFDREDLAHRTEDLAEFIVEASERHGFSMRDLMGVGYSNGANILLYLLSTRPEYIGASALFRPMSGGLADEIVPLNLPVFIAAGENDTMIEKGDAETIRDSLTKAGARVEYFSSFAGHGLTREDIDAAAQWLAKI